MSSKRQTIRQRVTQTLKGKTDVGDSVFSNTSAPTWVEHLPVILVRTLSESVEKFSETPREFKRELQIMLEVIVQGQENGTCPDDCETFVEDKLDTIVAQAEFALFADDRLGCDANGKAFVDDLVPLSAEFDFVADGEKPIGSARMIYQATYFEYLPAENTIGLSPFEKAQVDFKVGHHDNQPDDQIELHDLVDIP